MKARPPLRTAGFTLVELVLALGMASVFLVGIFTVMSSGITSSADAGNDARVSLILRDVSQRLRGVPFVPENAASPVPAFDPIVQKYEDLYYDKEGRWLDQNDANLAKRNNFKVVVQKGRPKHQPDANTNMMAVIVKIYYPVQPVPNGKPLPLTPAPPPKAKFSYMVTPMTGRGWTDIDPDYVPKIEG